VGGEPSEDTRAVPLRYTSSTSEIGEADMKTKQRTLVVDMMLAVDPCLYILRLELTLPPSLGSSSSSQCMHVRLRRRFYYIVLLLGSGHPHVFLHGFGSFLKRNRFIPLRQDEVVCHHSTYIRW